jgi:hypothetical protein
MCAGILPAANGESDEPHHEEHGGRDPEQMDGEPGSEQDEHEK